MCHAGIGQYINPDLAAPIIKIKPLLQKTVQTKPGTPCFRAFFTHTQDNNFTWNRFTANPNIDQYARAHGCGLIFPSSYLNTYLNGMAEKNSFRIDGIIRGHDHLIGGINQLRFDASQESSWSPVLGPRPLIPGNATDGYPVFTVTSMPDFFYHDAFAILTFDKNAGLWTLTPHVSIAPHADDEKRVRWKNKLNSSDVADEEIIE